LAENQDGSKKSQKKLMHPTPLPGMGKVKNKNENLYLLPFVIKIWSISMTNSKNLIRKH
jgi:hypothetical protein